MEAGKVLDQDGQQVLVKYGNNCIRVYPYRQSLSRNAYNNLNPNGVQKSTEPSQIREKHNSHIILESESEDEIIQQKTTVTMIQTLKIKKKPFSKTLTQFIKMALKKLTI